MPASTCDRPAHVDPDLEVDFDFYRPGPLGADPFDSWATLREARPLVWTPHYGGHWITTKGSVVRDVLTDPARFSSRCVFIPATNRPRAVPLEYDPPEHEALRQALRSAFLPKSINRWVKEARDFAAALIDDLVPQGGCEFIADFARQLPILVFLRMVDLPLADRERLLGYVEACLRPTDEPSRQAARAQMNAYISALVARRRAEPGDDVLSQAMQADIGGRVMNEAEALGTASGLLGGGLDTVAATMGWIALFLAEHPEHRARLAREPAMIPRAVDELMRRFAVPNIARVVVADMAYQGARLKAGEQILVPACLHGMDEQCFVDAMRVDFDRFNARDHSTFSQGIHRCIASALALQEIHIFLQEWLPRIPAFSLVANDPPVRATGIVHALTRLPLQWAA
jgi:cytochrome P450